MENRELKEYLAEFADNAQMSIIIANPKKRKVYILEELFMIKDEKIGQPVLCIQIAEEREMKEDEIKAAEEEEKREKYEIKFPKLLFFNFQKKRRLKMNNQQAIDRLVKHLEWGWTEETVEAIEMGIHALKETQWIPCSEKMPEDNTDVIVCFYSGTVTEMRYWGNGIFQGIYEHTAKTIVAWMPLPEPYKGE